MKKILLFSWLYFTAALVWAQCTVHEISTRDTIVCGQSAVLSAYGQGPGIPILSENFNSGSYGPGWSGPPQAMWNNPCGPNTIDGSTYLWMGTSSPLPRELITASFDLSSCTNAGVTVCFDMRYSIQGDASPCEGPDLPSEGVYLQYSTNNGTTWNTIQYWDPNGGTDPHLTVWNQYCVQVPVAALVSGVKFRWYQDDDSGTDYDHWGLDNVAVSCNDPSYNIVWQHDGYNAGAVGGTDPTAVKPHTTTSYIVVMSNGTVSCRDTVTVAVVNPIAQPNAGNDTSVCTGTCAILHGSAKIIQRPAKVPTYHNISPDTASLSTFGGVINQGAGVQLNVATLNMTNILPNSILEVCVDKVMLMGLGINARNLQLVLMCPDSSFIILVPDSTATGGSGLFSYNTIYNQTCFVPAGSSVSTGTPPYTGTFGTSQPFNNLVGCTANGVWTLLISPTAGIGSATAIVTGWSITFNDPEISYQGNFTWSPTTNMTNSNTLNPTVCPPPNAYTLTISDTGGCVTASDIVNVTTHTCCNFNITAAVTQPSCGNNNGAINLTITPAGNYSFAWSDGPSTAQNRSTLAAGQYHVTITDNTQGCTKDTIITLNSSSNLTVNFTNPVNPTCAGNNGSVTVTLAGGNGPYSVTLDTGGTPQTFTIPIAGSESIPNLHAGTITVSVTDAGACQANNSVTLTAPANCCAFTISITPTQPSCGNSNGSATVAVQNGSGNYTYAWSNGSTTATASNLPAGNVTVTVTDNGQSCSKNTSATLNSNSSLTVNFTNPVNPTCAGNDGSVTVTLAGGTGPYSVTLDTDGTPQTFTVPIAGSENVPGLHAGTITVSVTDAGACQANNTVTLTAATNCCIFGISITPTQPSCGNSNGSATVAVQNGSGNYTYLWSNGSTTATASNLPAGNVSVTVTDNGQSCTKDTSSTLNSNSSLTVNFTNPVNPSCAGNDGSVTITLAGGTAPYSVTLDTGGTPQTFTVPIAGSENVTGLHAGTINISVTDAGSCQASNTVTLTAATNCCVFTLGLTTIQPNCGASNGSATVTVQNGSGTYTYAWSNGTTVATAGNLPAGNTSVTVTDVGQGCSKDTAFILNSNSTLNLNFSNQVNPTCAGYNGSVTINLSGGTAPYTLIIDTGGTPQSLTVPVAGSQSLSNLNPITINASVTDAQGCQAAALATLPAPVNTLAINNVSPDNESCNGAVDGSISITVSGGTTPYTYLWSNSATSQNITGVPVGTYSVTITDANLCTTSTANISVNEPLLIGTATSATAQSCATQHDGTASVAATGGNPPYGYLWSNGASTATITNLSAGTYFVTVTDAHNCVATDSATVALPSSLLVSSNPQAPLCPPLTNGFISVAVTGGTPAYTYRWNNGQSDSSAVNLSPGNYSVTITDANGCFVTDSFLLQYQYSLSLTAGPGATIKLGQGTVVTVTPNVNNGLVYNWHPITGLDCPTCETTNAAPAHTITYYVDAADTNGCKATDSVMVEVIPDYDLFLPNAFTPNGDGYNDFFEMFGNKQAITYWSISIFDRWGEKVFESNDVNFKWDGTYRGKLLEPGVYVYAAKAVFQDSYDRAGIKGSITIVR